MRSNYPTRMRENLRVSVAGLNARKKVEAMVQEARANAEEERLKELDEVLALYEECLFLTLCREYGWGKVRCHRLWKQVLQLRMEARRAFREEEYQETATGNNLEDHAIRRELSARGIDVRKWMRNVAFVEKANGEVEVISEL